MKKGVRLASTALAVLSLLGFSGQARAEDKEGRDYFFVRGPNPGSTYVKIADAVNIDTVKLAARFNVTPFDIREDNPTKTLALCKDPKDGWRRTKGVNTPEGRRTNAIWATCPEELRFVYLVPGETVQITGVRYLSLDKKVEIANNLKKCEDASCVQAQLAEAGSKLVLGSDSVVAPAANAEDTRIVQSFKACKDAACVQAELAKLGSTVDVTTATEKVVVKEVPVEKVVVVENPVPQEPAFTKEYDGAGGGPADQSATMSAGVAKLLLVLACIVGTAALAHAFMMLLQLVSFVLGQYAARNAVRKANEENEIASQQLEMSTRQVRTLKDQLHRAHETLGGFKKSLAERADALGVDQSGSLDLASLWQKIVAREEDLRKSLTERVDAAVDDLRVVRDQFLNQANDLGLTLAQEPLIEELVGSVLAAKDDLLNAAQGEVKNLKGSVESAKAAVQRLNDKVRRCGELFAQLSKLDIRLIAIDNRITELSEPYAALKATYDDLFAKKDASAIGLFHKLQPMDQELAQLNQERLALMTEVSPLREEFEALHKELAGFEYSAAALYQEAQRDRNDAARVLGEAMAKERQIASREVVLARDKQRINDLAPREEACVKLTAQLRRLMKGLLEAMGYNPEMSLDQIEKLNGASGLIHDAAMRLATMQRERDFANAQLEEARADRDRMQTRFDEICTENHQLHVRHDADQKQCAQLTVSSEAAHQSVCEERDGLLQRIKQDLEPRIEAQVERIDELIQEKRDLEASLRELKTAADTLRTLNGASVSPAYAPIKEVKLRSFVIAADRVSLAPPGHKHEIDVLSGFWTLYELLTQPISISFEVLKDSYLGTPDQLKSLLATRKVEERLEAATFTTIPWIVDTLGLVSPRKRNTLAPAGVTPI